MQYKIYKRHSQQKKLIGRILVSSCFNRRNNKINTPADLNQGPSHYMGDFLIALFLLIIVCPFPPHAVPIPSGVPMPASPLPGIMPVTISPIPGKIPGSSGALVTGFITGVA